MNGDILNPNPIPRAPDGKIATTATVNRVVDAINQGAIVGHGDVDPGGSSRRAKAVVASVDTSGGLPWVYELNLVFEGGDPPTGLQVQTDKSYAGYNRWEISLTNAGYENGSVAGIFPLPVGAPVECEWIECSDGSLVLSFSERNEPDCG